MFHIGIFKISSSVLALRKAPGHLPGLTWHSCDPQLRQMKYNITWMARALLGNGPVNTPRPNTYKAAMEDVSQEGMLLHIVRQKCTNEEAG
jgi:hypothetical protein